MTTTSPAQVEKTIRDYFSACNETGYQNLVDIFTPNAAPYLPPGLPEIPRRDADTIARKWIRCSQSLGSRRTIEEMLCSSTAPEAVIGWTRWKDKAGIALRGDEWHVFDKAIGRIQEIRAYYASPADSSVATFQLHDSDYAARGRHLKST